MPNINDGCERINEMLADVFKEAKNSTDAKLGEAADYLKGKLEAATPVKTWLTKASWQSIKNYKMVKYVNNTRLAKNGIPVVNLLEYSKKGKPFMRSTFANAEPKIVSIINSSDIGGK